MQRFQRILFVLFLAVVCGGAASHQSGAPRGWHATPDVFPVLTIRSNAGLGANAGVGASGSMVLQSDIWNKVLVATGDLCSSTLATAAPGTEPAFGEPGVPHRAAAYWSVEARLVSTNADRVTFDLRWSRFVNDVTLIPAEPASEVTTISMREGGSGILDLVRRADVSRHGCGSFAISLDVGFGSAVELSNAALAYDVWLVQRDRDGAISTDRCRVRGQQGEQTKYFFRPIHYAADGIRTQAAAHFTVSVSGSIRGYMRRDGLIDLTVDAWWNAGHPGGGVGAAGRKLITVRPGETVEFEAPRNESRISGIPGLADVVDSQRTAIRVTARRLW